MRSPMDVVLEADTSFHVPTSFSFAICAKAPADYENNNIRRFQKPPTEESPVSERETRHYLKRTLPTSGPGNTSDRKMRRKIFRLTFTIGVRLGRGPIGRTPHC